MGRPPIPLATRRRLDEAASLLRELVPDGWTVNARALRDRRDLGRDLLAGRRACRHQAYVIDRLVTRDLDRVRFADGGNTMVVASWLSPRTRDLLRARGVHYLDLTGNVDVAVRSPAVVWRTSGADRDPKPLPRSGPSLRGPKGWALLRKLIEVAPPYRAGELAAALDVDDGYVSRALRVLADDQLIERRPRARSQSSIGKQRCTGWCARTRCSARTAPARGSRRPGRNS